MSNSYNINPLALSAQRYLLGNAGFILAPLRITYSFDEIRLLPESAINIISIDIDNTSTNISGNLYITMRNHFLVVNLATMSITDMYTKDTAGKSLEKLDYEGIEKSSLN